MFCAQQACLGGPWYGALCTLHVQSPAFRLLAATLRRLAFLNPAAAAVRDSSSSGSQPLAVLRVSTKSVVGAIAYGLLWSPGAPCSARKLRGLIVAAPRFDRVHPGVACGRGAGLG